MPKRERRSIAERLHQAEDRLQDSREQRITELERELQELQKVNAAIKGNSSLEESLEKQFEIARRGKGVKIPVSQIVPFRGQPRKTFPESEILEMSVWLEKDGQREAVRVIDIGRSTFEIWDGERRWRAAQRLGWENLDAHVLEIPENLHLEILKGFLSRKELNPLDRVEAIIVEIEKSVALPQEEVVATIRSAVRKLERSGSLKELDGVINVDLEERSALLGRLNLSYKQERVLQQLLEFQQNPSTFAAVDLLAFRLPDELKEAIRRRGIAVGAATALRKLWINPPSDLSVEEIDKLRCELIQKIVKERLSVASIRKIVGKFYQSRKEAKPIGNVESLVRDLPEINMEELSDDDALRLKNILESTIQRLNKIIARRLEA